MAKNAPARKQIQFIQIFPDLDQIDCTAQLVDSMPFNPGYHAKHTWSS